MVRLRHPEDINRFLQRVAAQAAYAHGAVPNTAALLRANDGERGPLMSRSPKEAQEEALDLERLVIDSDYRQEVMVRLKAESDARRAERAGTHTSRLPTTRKD
ncbi:MAG TPA: hypothetical protein VJN67_12950 [Stellaceae bacterium]|nr:hypothetical protein [Stellaceae bacterium]